MSKHRFPPPEVPSLAIAGGRERCAVSRIFCVGRNDHAHAIEIRSDIAAAP